MNDINLYCDESNHLAHNPSKIMTLGYISCDAAKTRIANITIRQIKKRHGISEDWEIKWTKVSPGKIEFYLDIIKFFFQTDYLCFRCVMADKSNLDYSKYNISHDKWYYIMYYYLLGKTLNEEKHYSIYLDIKDTCSRNKVKRLKEILNNSYYDFSSIMIKNIQQVRSHEVELIQLCDLIIGAIGYNINGYDTSSAKLEVVNLIKSLSGLNLNTSTHINNTKFNLFLWEARK